MNSRNTNSQNTNPQNTNPQDANPFNINSLTTNTKSTQPQPLPLFLSLLHFPLNPTQLTLHQIDPPFSPKRPGQSRQTTTSAPTAPSSTCKGSATSGPAVRRIVQKRRRRKRVLSVMLEGVGKSVGSDGFVWGRAAGWLK
jgi:hypothetical protein